MANLLPDDILLPQSAASRPRPIPVAAFVPIAVAMLGVAAILFGGVSARDMAVAEDRAAVDPMTTGSIAIEAPAPAHPQRWE